MIFTDVGKKDMYLLHHEEIESLGAKYAGNQADPLLHDLWSELPDPFEVSGERRHDFHRADYVRGKGDRTAAVLKGSASGSGIPWSANCRKNEYRLYFPWVRRTEKRRQYYLYNICDHQECYKEVGSQAISYTTGVPAMIGAMMVMTGTWKKAGRL